MNQTAAVSSQRRLALQSFKKLVAELATQLHPEDVDFEPLNFAEWMRTCDECDRSLLASMISTVSLALGSARQSAEHGVPHSALYVRMRSPFLEYAQRAAKRRFNADCLLDLDEHKEF